MDLSSLGRCAQTGPGVLRAQAAVLLRYPDALNALGILEEFGEIHRDTDLKALESMDDLGRRLTGDAHRLIRVCS